jgi:hypothetical protein
MIESFIVGVLRASRHWKMVLLLVATNLLFAVPLAAPVFLLVLQTTAGTRAAERMFADKLDFLWLADAVNGQFTDASLASTAALVGVLLVAVGALYLLLNMFFAGGILSVLAGGRDAFTLRRFWAGCGAYFGRFFRLWLISLFFYSAAFIVYGLLMIPVRAANARSSAEQPGVVRRWLVVGALLLLFALVNMAVDYAKIGAVVNGRRRMFREVALALTFSFRHFPRTYSLYLLIAVTGLLLFSGFTGLRAAVPQSSFVTVLLALLLGQLALAARMWTRVAFYAAEMNLYKRLAPPREVAAEATARAPKPVAGEPPPVLPRPEEQPAEAEGAATAPVLYDLKTEDARAPHAPAADGPKEPAG